LNMRILILCLLPFYVISSTLSVKNKEIDSLQLQLTKPLPDSLKLKTYAYLVKSLCYQNPALARVYAKEGVILARRLGNEPTRARLLNTTGNIYRMTSEYSSALSYFFQSLKIAESINDSGLESYVLNNIATVYIAIGQYPLAEKHLLEALKIATRTGLKSEVGSTYANLGIVTFNQKKYNESILYNKKAIEENVKNGKVISSILNNMGDIYNVLNKPAIAEYYYKKAINTVKVKDNGYIYFCASLGEFYTKQNRFAEGFKYLFIAKDLSDSLGINIVKADILKTIAAAFEKQKDFRKANIYLKEFYALRDSTLNETVARQINEMQAKYESDKKDKEIQVLNQKQQITEAKADKESLIASFTIVAFVVGIIIILIIGRNIVLKQRVKNKALNEEKVMLLHENAEARYETLRSKVDPHFLFNNLNTLSSIVTKNQPLAVEYIERFSELYRMVLKTENQPLVALNEEMQVVNNYLYLQKIEFGDKLGVDIDNFAEATLLYVPPFAVQIVVENVIKHNIITRLRNLSIHMSTEGDWIVIRNNLQKKQAGVRSTHTGQKSITGRYELLTDLKPLFLETETEYIVKLPLLRSRKLIGTNED
jgi:hypothetical protein